MKALLLALLLLALSVLSTDAHDGGGKSGVQRCIDRPQDHSEMHCDQHWANWISQTASRGRFISWDEEHYRRWGIR